MDTSTVLTIIEMIDTRIKGLIKLLEKADSVQWTAQVEILTSLSNRLQSFIESQVSALENSAGE